MNALRLGLVVASLLCLFAPLRSDDSVYAPASGGFAVEHKLKSMVVSVDFNDATIEEATQALLQAAAYGSGFAHIKLLIRKFFGLGRCQRDFMIAGNWMKRCASLKQDRSNYASVAFAQHLELTCGQTLCEGSPIPRLYSNEQLRFQLGVFEQEGVAQS